MDVHAYFKGLSSGIPEGVQRKMNVHAYSGETTQELQRKMNVHAYSGETTQELQRKMNVHAYSGETTQELQRNMSPIWIAHRGNTRGPKPEKENQPEYILQAIQEGFDVEIDVWMFTHISLDDQRESKEIWSEGKMPSHSDRRSPNPTENGIDIWLGHDNPQYQIPLSFLTINEDRLWCHAKNFHALTFLVEHGFHTFSHDKDTHVLTSRGVIWAYVGKNIDKNTICVMPERAPQNTYTNKQLNESKGICTDYIWVIEGILKYMKT